MFCYQRLSWSFLWSLVWKLKGECWCRCSRTPTTYRWREVHPFTRQKRCLFRFIFRIRGFSFNFRRIISSFWAKGSGCFSFSHGTVSESSYQRLWSCRTLRQASLCSHWIFLLQYIQCSQAVSRNCSDAWQYDKIIFFWETEEILLRILSWQIPRSKSWPS